MEANVNDRASIEAAYPPAAFAEDSGENGRATAGMLRGVRILRGPGPDGGFALERSRRHVGENVGDSKLSFLAPFLEEAAAGEAAPYGTMPAAAPPPKQADYARFIDRLIEAARGFCLDRSPGPGDERLAGPRQ